MPIEADLVYRNRDQIVAGLINSLRARIPDIVTEEDTNIRIFFEVIAGEIEGIYLASQILHDNIFIHTANLTELRRHGEQFGLEIKPGLPAEGIVTFTGDGGTLIPAGSMIGVDPGIGDLLYFFTTQDATIPNPGIPDALTAADSTVAGNLVAGTYEYVVTFVTEKGETIAGLESDPVILSASRQMSLTAIPLGGPGTTKRRIYRSFNGDDYKLVTEITNNTATTYTDDVANASLGVEPPVESTAERAEAEAQSETFGSVYNVVTGAVIELIEVPDGVTDVTNEAAFTGGTDEEDLEDYRTRLLKHVRNAQTGSASDLESWALEVDGVYYATAFPNYNGTTPANGYVTVRIAGADGEVPTQLVVDAVQAALDLRDMANIVIVVTTFTPKSVAVTADVTLASTYLLADVTPSVDAAIRDYLLDVPIGGTAYPSGIIDAVFGLAGIVDVTLSVPAAPVTSLATEKIVPGTITIT